MRVGRCRPSGIITFEELCDFLIGGVEILEQLGTGNRTFDTVTGTITFADVDLTDRPVVSAAISETNPFSYHDAEGHDITAE